MSKIIENIVSWLLDEPKKLENFKSPPSTPPSVKVYEHCLYGGSSKTLPIGNYDTSSLGNNLSGKVSALRVPSGLKAALYSGPNFSGTLKEIKGDAICLNNSPYYFNDKTKSIRVLSSSTLTPQPNPAPSPPPSPPPSVKLYKDCNPSSTKTPDGNLGIGNYDTKNMGVQDKKLSALKVSPGLKAALYSGPTFSGDVKEITSDVSCLTSSSYNFNDKTSSIRVLSSTTPVPPPNPTNWKGNVMPSISDGGRKCGPNNNKWACPSQQCCAPSSSSAANTCGGVSGIQDSTYCTNGNTIGYYTGRDDGHYDGIDFSPPKTKMTIHKDTNRTGRNTASYNIGDYNTLGNLNQAVSSVSISPGLTAALYSDTDFTGTLKVVTENVNSLPDFDNMASSLRVRAKYASIPPPVPYSQISFSDTNMIDMLKEKQSPDIPNSCSVYYVPPEQQKKCDNDFKLSASNTCKLDLPNWKRAADAPIFNATTTDQNNNRGNTSDWAFCFQQISRQNGINNILNNTQNAASFQMNSTAITGLDGDTLSYARLAFKNFDFSKVKKDVCSMVSISVQQAPNLDIQQLFGIEIDDPNQTDPTKIKIKDIGIYTWNNGKYSKVADPSFGSFGNALFTEEIKGNTLVLTPRQASAIVYIFEQDICGNNVLVKKNTGTFGLIDYLYNSVNYGTQVIYTCVYTNASTCATTATLKQRYEATNDLAIKELLGRISSNKRNAIRNAINSIKDKPLQSSLKRGSFPTSLISKADKRIYMYLS